MFGSASAPPSGLRSSRTEHPQPQQPKGWARTNRRSGPSQVAKVTAGQAWRRQAGDVRFSWVHTYLWHQAERQGLSTPEEDEAEAETKVAQRDRCGAAPHPASVNRRTGALAGLGAARALCLLRCADQLGHRSRSPAPGQGALVPQPPETESKEPEVEAHERDRREVPADAERSASMARPTLPRQAPKVGAVCGNPARTDLCGGRSAMTVPTAIGHLFGRRKW